MKNKLKKILTVLVVLGFVLGVSVQLGLIDKIQLPRQGGSEPIYKESVKIVEEQSDVVKIVEEVGSSVVTVKIKQTRQFLEFEPFDPFGFFNRPQQREEQIERNIGSGFVVAENGWVVTNKHVVSNEDASYEVVIQDGKAIEVGQIFRDPANDLAILKTNSSELKPVTLGNSDELKVGQTVVAMGTPLGEFQGSVTKGIVSGLGRGIQAGSPLQGFVERLDNVIQTDAAINPGNSGGPLLNAGGQVVGVNTAVASGAENIGFAIPINVVKDALDNFRETGSFQRAFLGVSYRIVTRELSVMNEIPEGAYVAEVQPGSAAENAGIRQGDIVVRFDGERVNQETDLSRLIEDYKAGDEVTLEIWREGETFETTVTLGQFSQ